MFVMGVHSRPEVQRQRKKVFPKLSLVLGTIRCCEMDDLSCLYGYLKVVGRAGYVRVDSLKLIR